MSEGGGGWASGRGLETGRPRSTGDGETLKQAESYKTSLIKVVRYGGGLGYLVMVRVQGEDGGG